MTNTPGIYVVLAILAVWRVTHLLWGEDGPGDIIVRLRRVAGYGGFGRLMDCFDCLRLWVAAPFALVLGNTWLHRILLWLGLSGGAILLERFASRSSPIPPSAIWREEPQSRTQEKESTNDVMLR